MGRRDVKKGTPDKGPEKRQHKGEEEEDGKSGGRISDDERGADGPNPESERAQRREARRGQN